MRHAAFTGPADYRNGNVATILGWQIARTQAELRALAYFPTEGLM